MANTADYTSGTTTTIMYDEYYLINQYLLLFTCFINEEVYLNSTPACLPESDLQSQPSTAKITQQVSSRPQDKRERQRKSSKVYSCTRQ